jgi:acetyltransferase (GNAT) family protein
MSIRILRTCRPSASRTGRTRTSRKQTAGSLAPTFCGLTNPVAGGRRERRLHGLSARGQGIGRAMAQHCLNGARRLGFRTMQFNFVISTNTAAIRLWQELGFEIAGTLPGAFRHPEKGYVDVYVMYPVVSLLKQLKEGRQLFSVWGTVDLSCNMVASLIPPSGF